MKKTKLIILIPVLMLLLNKSADAGFWSPDTNLNILDKGVVATKMVDGRNKFYMGDYRGALNSYREVLAENDRHALAHLRIAECHYELMNWELCKEYLDKAVSLDPKVNAETDYLNGKVLHRMEKLDEATAAFEKFKAAIKPEKVKDYDLDLFLAQIKTAKEFMAKPLSVTLQNAGTNINSKSDDYSPIVTPDGKTLYFTSRRSNSTGGLKANDDSYFEDVYFAKLKEDGTWDEADVVEGNLNSDQFDNCSHISADGMTMYLTLNIGGYTKSSDIAYSKLSKSGKWGTPKLMPKGVNGTYFDACPTLTADDKTMYFVSERNGENFGSDIFKVSKISGSKWGDPIAVSSLNSAENETTVWLHPNGKWIFFSSKGHNSMGGYDIFAAEWTGTNWGAPKNLGYPINTVNDDTHFRISPDGKYAYFSSVRANGVGDRDIYVVDITSLDWIK